jgi:geranylgeranyl reductase family protein
MKVDVAIIGAGPGGGMAACRLAQTGLQVIILEKCRLPRSKACAGALPVGVTTLFDWDITPLIKAEVSSIEFLYNYTKPKIFKQSKPFILMVERTRFDNDLVERAVSSGHGNVILRDEFRVVKVEESDHGVMIYGKNQETIQTDFVIAADGAFSPTARCLGLNREAPHGLAIDAEVEVVPEIFEDRKAHATFNFYCWPQGYGWIFPGNGYLKCGVGPWRGEANPGWSRAMDDFLAKSFPPGSIRSVQRNRHPVPTYAGHREIATQRVCLVGDAANLVEPIMGEGIRFALQSGSLAANVIISLIQGWTVADIQPENVTWQNGACRVYQTLIHQGFGYDMDILYRYALPIFLDAPEFFYRKFMTQGYSYSTYFLEIAGQLGELKLHSGSRAR